MRPRKCATSALRVTITQFDTTWIPNLQRLSQAPLVDQSDEKDEKDEEINNHPLSAFREGQSYH